MCVKKLDLGSGGRSSPLGNEWISVDLHHPEAELQVSMGSLPYEDNEISEIHSSHSLEHVAKKEVLPTLVEWKRVLKPGGALTLIIPDLEWCVQHWLKNRSSLGWELDIIFGNQNHEGEFHKTGFTRHTIQMLVEAAGFIILSNTYVDSHGQRSIEVKAVA